MAINKLQIKSYNKATLYQSQGKKDGGSGFRGSEVPRSEVKKVQGFRGCWYSVKLFQESGRFFDFPHCVDNRNPKPAELDPKGS
jgi:hypothetical protein